MKVKIWYYRETSPSEPIASQRLTIVCKCTVKKIKTEVKPATFLFLNVFIGEVSP